MAGFIPAYRVSITDGSTKVTFVDNAHGWSFVLLATLEILETIKLTSGGGEWGVGSGEASTRSM